MGNISRRTFFKRAGMIAGCLAVAPSIACKVLAEPKDNNPLFNGEIGRYEGVTFHSSDSLAAKRWSEALWKEVQKESFFSKFSTNG